MDFTFADLEYRSLKALARKVPLTAAQRARLNELRKWIAAYKAAY